VPHVRIVIAGGETLFDYRDYRARWDARAAELGVAPVVLGAVPDPELPALVAAAAAFAFPSAKEGFGLAAMEALAAGVPLVLRDLPVLREVFGAAARFATDAPSIATHLAEALAGDDPQRRAAGKRLAARHTWAAAARRHVAFYHRHSATGRGPGLPARTGPAADGPGRATLPRRAADHP
jgi:glycosyltransferase involved in cell wall biosynthesis